MLIIGLTGGIGSGKSTVADLFVKRSIPVIDTDVIARTITQPNTKALDKIIDHFGDVLRLEDGSLNRRQLGKIIFDHPKEKLWLENLLHPLILNEVRNQLQKLDAPYCVVVIPLLVEVSPYDYVNRILVVDVSTHAQIQRVKMRDNVANEYVEKIMQAQTSREQRLAKAHDIINNEGDLKNLDEQVEKLHQTYLKISQETKELE